MRLSQAETWHMSGLFFQVIQNFVGNQIADADIRFLGDAGDMRRQNDVGKPSKTRAQIRRQRLDLKNIQRGAAQTICLQ